MTVEWKDVLAWAQPAADSLEHLTRAGWAALSEHGVRTVIGAVATPAQ